MAWLNVICLPSNFSTHTARPRWPAEFPRLLSFLKALRPNCPQALGQSSGLSRVGESRQFRPLELPARSREGPPSFRARTVEIISTLSTRNTAAFHPLLKFQPFRDAWVWHPHCLNRMGGRSQRFVRLLPLSGPGNKRFSG